MQIERFAAPMAAVTGKAVATGIQITETDSAPDDDAPDTSQDNPTAQPLTGGSRTVSFGMVEFEMNFEAEIPYDFADLVAEKTRLLSTTLTDLFKSMGIRMDEGITLSMDSIGGVTSNGPGKDKIERLFHDNRELGKQLKEVMVLQSMLAMKMALEKWLESRKKASTDDERDAADQAFLRDAGTIKALQFTMVLSPEGDLTSAALAYMNGAR